MSALRECPFCGGEADIEANPTGTLWTIWCPGRECPVDVEVRHVTGHEAIAAWNRRHVPEGFALVPVEPTEAMVVAAEEAMPLLSDAIRAAIAAAKEPK